MKTTSTLKKNMLSKVTKVLAVAAFMCMSFTSKAQCTASFISNDSAAAVYFFNTSTGSGLTSAWDFGDGSVGTSTGDITHIYSATGTYYVCLTVTNFLGTCTSTYCDSISIVAIGSGACMGIVNPTYTYTESAGTIYFSNTPSGSSPVYFWDFGDGANSSTVGSTSHTYTANGSYLVCLTVYEATGTDSCQFCSYVNVSTVPPGCSLSMNIVQDTLNLFNYFVYFTGSTPGGPTSYLWDFGDGTSSTLPYPSHTYSTSSPVLVCLTISDGLLCTMTDCDSIATPGMMVPTSFTLNVVNPLGITENENAITSLENYPNPFNENTTINYAIKKEANVSVSIIDVLGNTIANIENGNKAAGEYSITWNSQGVSEGIYLLQLKVNTDIKTKKIIVTK